MSVTKCYQFICDHCFDIDYYCGNKRQAHIKANQDGWIFSKKYASDHKYKAHICSDECYNKVDG